MLLASTVTSPPASILESADTRATATLAMSLTPIAPAPATPTPTEPAPTPSAPAPTSRLILASSVARTVTGSFVPVQISLLTTLASTMPRERLLENTPASAAPTPTEPAPTPAAPAIARTSMRAVDDAVTSTALARAPMAPIVVLITKARTLCWSGPSGTGAPSSSGVLGSSMPLTWRSSVSTSSMSTAPMRLSATVPPTATPTPVEPAPTDSATPPPSAVIVERSSALTVTALSGPVGSMSALTRLASTVLAISLRATAPAPDTPMPAEPAPTAPEMATATTLTSDSEIASTKRSPPISTNESLMLARTTLAISLMPIEPAPDTATPGPDPAPTAREPEPASPLIDDSSVARTVMSKPLPV